MDRLVGWFSAVVQEMVKSLPYSGSYLYEVAGSSFDNQTLDLKPLGHSMPALDRVPMRAPGLRLEVSNGSEVVVAFANADPGRPFVAQYPQDPTAITKVEILGETEANAREGDSVEVTIPIGSFGVSAAPAAALVLNPAPVQVTGTVTSGSTKVFS